MTATKPKLDEFTTAYIEAALWSSTDNANEQGGEPLNANYSIDDIAPATLAEMVDDCRDFQQSFGDRIASNPARAGHDFWLTRNRHGAGFWDGDWPEADGRFLTAMSHPYGSVDLYVGDDGLIYSN